MLIEKSNYDNVMDEIEVEINYHESKRRNTNQSQEIDKENNEKESKENIEQQNTVMKSPVKRRKTSRIITPQENNQVSDNSDYEMDEEMELRLNEMDSKFQKGINAHSHQIDALHADLSILTKRIN